MVVTSQNKKKGRLSSCDRRLKAEFCGFVKGRLTANLRVVVSVKK